MSPPTARNSAPHQARGGHSGECQRVEPLRPPHQVNWLGAAYGLLWSPTCFPRSCYCHYQQHRASQGPPGRCCRGAGPQKRETMILSWLFSFAESSGAEEDGGVPCGPCSSLAAGVLAPRSYLGFPAPTLTEEGYQLAFGTQSLAQAWDLGPNHSARTTHVAPASDLGPGSARRT